MTTEMTKDKRRAAADWWQLLTEDKVKELMQKYFSGRIEAELKNYEIVFVWEREHNNNLIDGFK